VTDYQRKVCFAGRSVNVMTNTTAGQQIIHHLFQDVDATASIAPHGQFEIHARDKNWLLDLTTDEQSTTLYQGPLLGDLASVLVGEVIYHLTDRCDSGLVFHAAAVARDGATTALPAASGSGKTTLCAWLVSQGFRYQTDELVYLPLGSDQPEALTRPFNFKRPAYPLIMDAFGLDTDADYAVTGSFASLIAHRQLASYKPITANPVLTHLVFPRYTPEHRGELTRLTAARAGLSLMECLVNARNLPAHGFEEVSRLVRQLQPWSFEYSSFDTARTELLPVLNADN